MPGGCLLLAPLLWMVNAKSRRRALAATGPQILTGWEALSAPAPCREHPWKNRLCLLPSPLFSFRQDRPTRLLFHFTVEIKVNRNHFDLPHSRVKCPSRSCFSHVVSNQHNRPLLHVAANKERFWEWKGRGLSAVLTELALSKGPSHPWLPSILPKRVTWCSCEEEGDGEVTGGGTQRPRHSFQRPEISCVNVISS